MRAELQHRRAGDKDGLEVFLFNFEEPRRDGRRFFGKECFHALEKNVSIDNHAVPLDAINVVSLAGIDRTQLRVRQVGERGYPTQRGFRRRRLKIGIQFFQDFLAREIN